MAEIHAAAIVHPEADLADDVVVGPGAVIEAPVTIGAGTRIGPHAVIHPFVRVGAGNRISAHAVLGDLPQDLAYREGETWVVIGDGNVIREGATVQRSSDPETPTRLGNGCYLMAYAHLGHQSRVEDGAILANNVMLGGHVEVGEKAFLGGGAAIHQHVRVGRGAIVAGVAGVIKDVLPFSMNKGAPSRHYGLNVVGLRRAGVRGDRFRTLERAFRRLRHGEPLDDLEPTPELDFLRAWLAAPSRRGVGGFVKPGRGGAE